MGGAGLMQPVFVAMLLSNTGMQLCLHREVLGSMNSLFTIPEVPGQNSLLSQVHVFVCSPTNAAFQDHRLLWFYCIWSNSSYRLLTLPSICDLFQLLPKLMQSPFLLFQLQVIRPSGKNFASSWWPSQAGGRCWCGGCWDLRLMKHQSSLWRRWDEVAALLQTFCLSNDPKLEYTHLGIKNNSLIQFRMVLMVLQRSKA